MLESSVRRLKSASVKKNDVKAMTIMPAIYVTDSRYIADNFNPVILDTVKKEELKIFINTRPSISAAINDMRNSTDNIANSDRPDAP
jgi:hypothetical protein